MEDPVPLIHMPGSFFSDLERPVRPTLTKARPSLYIPPQSPSAASSLSKSYLSSRIPHSNTGSRKRARYDRSDSDLVKSPRIPQDDGHTTQLWAASTTLFDSAQSPAPLVSTNYRLAGGLDTPTAATASLYADDCDPAVLDYRPSRFPSQTQPTSDDYFPHTPEVLSKDRNGHKRATSSAQPQGWGMAVCNIVGGMAGKVLNFCWAGAFHGFHAGVGRGYAMDVATPIVIERGSWMDIKEKEDVFSQNYKRPRCREGTPIPGEFPEEGFIENYMTRPQFYQSKSHSTPSPTDDEKGGNRTKSKDTWVIVRSLEPDSRETSPTRKILRTNMVHQHWPVSRGATAARPRLAPSRPSRSSFAGPAGFSTTQQASFASTRQQVGDSSDSPQMQSSEGRHRRSQSSLASPRRSGIVRANRAIPASPDVQKFEKKLRQKERAQQNSIERMSQQTRDLLREAREALGTRVDIEDEVEMEDEGYGEGTELMSESKW